MRKTLFPLLLVLLVSGCAQFAKPRWEDAQSQDTRSAYEEFLKTYPESPFSVEARMRIDQLDFREAEQRGTISAYEKYLVRHPTGVGSSKAQEKLNELYELHSFAQAKRANTAEAYEEHLKKYPAGKYTGTVQQSYEIWKKEEREYRMAKDRNNVESYLSYLKKHPRGAFEKEAKVRLLLVLPIYVKEEVKKFTSRDALVRAGASYRLGTMGADAMGAVPFLIDEMGYIAAGVSLEWRRMDRPSGTGEPTWPANEARKALAKVGKPAVPFLIPALQEKESFIRQNAAWALGEIRDSEAVGPLIAALKDEDDDVRMSAAEALGNFKCRASVDALIPALLNPDRFHFVRMAAWRSLGKITGQKIAAEYASWKEWWDNYKGDISETR